MRREHPDPGALPAHDAVLPKVLIWDAPIRVFHVLFALCCSAAIVLALLGEDRPRLFGLHMVFGIAAVFVLIIRVALGILGGRNNRLHTMIFSPRETLAYFVGIVTGSAPRYAVHNPATSLVALVMFALVPILAWTGLDPERAAADEIHALLAYVLLALILAHMMGLAVHSLRHRENIATAMVSGHKRAPTVYALPTARQGWGAVILVTSLAWLALLFVSYSASAQTVTLPIIGTTIQLDAEENEVEGNEAEEDDAEREQGD